MEIVLTDVDREYAQRHGLTDEDMKGFIEDMIREQEELAEFYNRQIRAEHREMMNTPQCSVYDAW